MARKAVAVVVIINTDSLKTWGMYFCIVLAITCLIGAFILSKEQQKGISDEAWAKMKSTTDNLVEGSSKLYQSVFGGVANSGYSLNEDGSAYWIKEGIGSIEWDKFVTQGCSATRYLNITSYLASQDLDVCIKTERPLTTSQSDAWLWMNMSHDVPIKEWVNTTTCDDFNMTGCIENGYYNTIGYSQDYYFDWLNIKDKFNHYSYNNNDFYCLKNVYAIQNQKYELRLDFAFPIEKTKEGWGCKEKFGLVAKKSSESLSGAISLNHYIELDPWANSTYSYCRSISGFQAGNINEPVYVDLGVLEYDDEKMKSLTVYSGANCNGGSQVSYDFLEGNNSWIAFVQDGSSGYSVYYDNISHVDSSYDGDVFLFAEPFDQLKSYNAGDSIGGHWTNNSATISPTMYDTECYRGRCIMVDTPGLNVYTWGILSKGGTTGDVVNTTNATTVYWMENKDLDENAYIQTIGHSYVVVNVNIGGEKGAVFQYRGDANVLRVDAFDSTTQINGVTYLTGVSEWNYFKTILDPVGIKYYGEHWNNRVVDFFTVNGYSNGAVANVGRFQITGYDIVAERLMIDDIFIKEGDNSLSFYNITSNLTIGSQQSGNTAPSCTSADTNITVDEDSGSWTLDENMSIALNISCSDADGDALTYTEDGETGAGGSFTNPNNDDLVFTTSPNATGTRVVTYTVSDGSLSTKVSAQTIVNAVNDNPWWDEITNGTGTMINTGLGYQPININASQYYRDVEDDQTPTNITISVNESSVDCMMNTVSNFSIFCNPDSVSTFIITLNEPSVGSNSFEEYVAYPPSAPVITLPVTTTYHGNNTLAWTASVSPQGDEIAFYNLTIDFGPTPYVDWYYSIAEMNSTSYSWDTRELIDSGINEYYLQIDVCDNNSLCTYGLSNGFSINNTPHWDSIGNATALNIYVNHGIQPVIDNLSIYFHDYFDDQTPDSIVVDDNETGISCTIETNLSLFCTPTAFKGDYIIILNGTNSVANSSFESFEGFVDNTAPTIPTVLSPEDNALNDTNTLNLSCSGSTDPEGDTLYYDFLGDTTNPPTTSICLNIGGECLWNNTDQNTLVYWTCQANDTFENSTLTSIKGIRTETWDVINLTNNTIPYGYEGELITLTANVTWNEIRYKSMTGILNYSGTYYTPTQNNQDNYTELTITLNLPNVDDDITQYYNWLINLTYHNDSQFENNTYYGEIINKKIYFDGNCTEANASQSMAVNFSFWSENTRIELTYENYSEEEMPGIEYQATFIIYKDDISANETQVVDYTNITSYGLCIPKDEEFKSMITINYFEDLYDKRQYYFYQQPLNNVTQQIPLYLLEISLGDGIAITVKGASGSEINDAYIYVYKYYPGTDTYNLVSMGHTDNDGKDYLYLRKFDTFYKFEVWKAGVKLYTDVINRKIDVDTLTLTTTEATLGELLDAWNTISYTLTNDTDNVILTYIDSGTTASKYCLTVYKVNSSDTGYACETCLTTRTGTITCDASDYDGIYIANAWAAINPNRPFASLELDRTIDFLINFGKTGLFAAFLIILTLGCVGLWMGKVSTTVIGTLLGILISMLLGMLDIQYSVFIGLVICGIIVVAYAND